MEGKYRAVIEQVMECHKNGQPVLVGTVSVEKSEILAKMLQRHTRDFNVLNAKNHEREDVYKRQQVSSISPKNPEQRGCKAPAPILITLGSSP